MKPPYRHYRNLIRHNEFSQPREAKLVRYWRPAAAWIYLAICVFDFVVMPVYVAKTNISVHEAIIEINKLRPEDRSQMMALAMSKNAWNPLTLANNGMFHLAFGAILGVAAWTRGQLQQTQVQNGIFPAVEEPEGLPRPINSALARAAMANTPPPPIFAPPSNVAPPSPPAAEPSQDPTPHPSQNPKFDKFDSPD